MIIGRYPFIYTLISMSIVIVDYIILNSLYSAYDHGNDSIIVVNASCIYTYFDNTTIFYYDLCNSLSIIEILEAVTIHYTAYNCHV